MLTFVTGNVLVLTFVTWYAYLSFYCTHSARKFCNQVYKLYVSFWEVSSDAWIEKGFLIFFGEIA